jgi:hypothetical protein
MEKRNQYLVAVIFTLLFVAGTAFAFVIPAPSIESSSAEDTVCEGPCCDVASNSFASGNIQCDGKTGWEMIVELARDIR